MNKASIMWYDFDMNTVSDLAVGDINDKVQKITALHDLANEEMGVLVKEKQEIIKKIRVEKDQQLIKKVRSELGLKEKTQ